MDAAFKTAAYPSYTTDELRGFIAAVAPGPATERMVAEIARREAVAAGDVSVMTPGERLRHARAVETTDATYSYQRGVFQVFERNQQRTTFDRDELEIINMCGKLNRPFTNCASLIMRLRAKEPAEAKPAADQTPGISIQHLAKTMSESAAKNSGVAPELLYAPIFFALRDLVGWKLFDRDAA